MRDRLAQQMKQKVDDEDERIAKAQAEREAKREVSFRSLSTVLIFHPHFLTLLLLILQHFKGALESRFLWKRF